jgi:hypothetical protein
MQRKPPTPVVRSFLLVREIAQDVVTKEYHLIGPYIDIYCQQFPCVVQLNLLLELTSTHGAYAQTLQVRNLEDSPVWSREFERPLEAQDPLPVWMMDLRWHGATIPEPGKYDIVLLANGDEVARRPLHVHHRPQHAVG